MRSTFSDAVNDEKVYGSFCELFQGFSAEVLAEASLFEWVEDSFLFGIDPGGVGWMSIF